MDDTKANLRPNPRESASPFGLLFFTYTFGMFKKGFGRPLTVNDLYRPIKSDKSQVLGDRLERQWVIQTEAAKRKNRKPSFLKALVKTFWPEYSYLGIVLAVQEVVVRLLQPLMLGKLLEYFRPDSNVEKTEALWYAGAIVFLNALSALLINQYVMGAYHYGMKLRAACCALVYRKALRLSKSALADTASGKIVNLISNDVSRFDFVSILLHYLWVAPLSAIIVTYFLYVEAGYAGIIGILPMVLVVPLQSYTGKLSAIYRKAIASKTDERVRLMDEVISGVQVIKMYAWELPFTKIIGASRKAELREVAKSSYLRGLYMTFNLFTTRAALFCALLTMALTDQPITASKVFVFMSFFNVLAQSMSSMFVRGISEIAEVMVGITRLQQFMVNEEYSDINVQSTNEQYPVNLKNVSAKWDVAQPESALTNITLTVTPGDLLGVIGPVGSGKSSLLQALLGELSVTNGNLSIFGTVSYASQEPWVFAATVRQNILFGQEYENNRYLDVIRACALEQDFKQFPEGDLSLVGDRGASLSGGQKARINLARAVYRDADIYLLDDPLSAVDIHVSKHLYEKCINGYLVGKTRILVTHQVYHLKNADKIVILRNGEIEETGTYHELSKSDSEYAQLLTAEPEDAPQEDTKILAHEDAKVSANGLATKKLSSKSKTSRISVTSDDSNPATPLQPPPQEPKSKMSQEESSEGKVPGSLFLKYLSAGGNVIAVWFVILLYVLAQTAASGVDYFVSYWTNIEEFRNATESEDKTSYQWSTNLCLYVYGALIIALFVIAIARSLLFYRLAISCSQKLHAKLFSYVISATMRFFDTNPSGRILNRFSKDIGCIDEVLPKAILDAGQSILTLVGALVLVAVVNPYFLILVGIVSCLFLLLRMVFLRTSMAVKRIEGVMRSPVFTHLNATLQGLTTIRAFHAQDILKSDFDKHQDYHTSAWFMYIAGSAAFAFYLDFLVFIMIAMITFSFLTFGEGLGLQGGQIGLAITQCAALTGLIQWGMRQSADVSNQLMSVERVLEYEQLPKEKQPDKPRTPPKDWPDKGQLIFKNMGLKYDVDAPFVIKDLSITILPKEKVGVVGRTGAGKSSLIAALFRLANVSGDIEIDGIETKDILLQLLRAKISIIPQDPVLFSGTLRYNLDPFGEYADERLYRALEDVELKDPAGVFNRLEHRVMDRGSNYSVGQRQLICLARALVRSNKILMLDEATANVDPQTDALIQKTIREKFADCTVLTVAHRLNTIMDSDKVLVMDKGRMVEFDHPHLLLENSDSQFHKMVAETGSALEEQLKKIAATAYEKTHNTYM